MKQLKYYQNLYVSKVIKPKLLEIMDKLEKGQLQWNKYLIILAQGEQNHLEFFDSILLQQKVFLVEDLLVVGIAEGYKGALELVEEIMQEVYNKTGGTNIRNYIISKQKEFEEGDI